MGGATNEPCERDTADCIEDLAGGWITASDLCAPCTRFLMRALDKEYGSPLPWHQNYIDRGRPEGGYPE